MNECIAFGEWLLVNYIPISGGWWRREKPVFGRTIPTNELYFIFKEGYIFNSIGNGLWAKPNSFITYDDEGLHNEFLLSI